MFWTVADVRAITEGDVGLFGVRFRNGRCWGTNEVVGGSLYILEILSGRECDFDLKFGQVFPCLEAFVFVRIYAGGLLWVWIV